MSAVCIAGSAKVYRCISRKSELDSLSERCRISETCCPATMGTGGARTGGTMRLWGGRFSENGDERVADFTRSIEIDAVLALDDLRGSIAHVRGLGRAGLLGDAEIATLVDGLEGLARDVEAGTLAWDPGLEDVHMNLEA